MYDYKMYSPFTTKNINKHSFALLLHTYYIKTLLVASIPAYCDATKLKEPWSSKTMLKYQLMLEFTQWELVS